MKKTSGLSLIEMLAAAVVGAVLLLIATPALLRFYQDSVMTSTANQFATSLQYARGQALSLRTTVRVCRSEQPSATPVPVCNPAQGDQGYESGWIVYADPPPGDDQPNQPEDVLQVVDLKLPEGFSIHGNSHVASQVGFTALGTALGTNGVGNGTIVLCDRRGWADNGKYARVVVISTPGRIRTVTGDASSVKSC